ARWAIRMLWPQLGLRRNVFEKEDAEKEMVAMEDEFGIQLRPWPERVLQIINTVRAEEGSEPISG
ncbi:MAG: hypothetical protein VXV97_16480, partial [Pseudomonadota bacterium]|nr:hypothetical protein [Pseudomonadota bacterium]